jgi:hypothetical protein
MGIVGVMVRVSWRVIEFELSTINPDVEIASGVACSVAIGGATCVSMDGADGGLIGAMPSLQFVEVASMKQLTKNNARFWIMAEPSIARSNFNLILW